MKLQVKRERWQCAVTAFAMALDIPVANLIERLGHDGGMIVFPDLAEPANRRGHSIYELIHTAVELGFAVTPMPLRAAITPANDPRRQFILGTDADNWTRFTTQLRNARGVVECSGPRVYHMIAFDHGRIYDPDGCEFLYSREACERRNLYTYCLWRVDRIEP